MLNGYIKPKPGDAALGEVCPNLFVECFNSFPHRCRKSLTLAAHRHLFTQQPCHMQRVSLCVQALDLHLCV